MKAEKDLSNYATKADLKTSAGVGTSDYVKKTDLAYLKSDLDKLDIDKLKSVPSNLSNLKSKVDKLDVHKLLPVFVDLKNLKIVKNDVVIKDKYNAEFKDIEVEILDITNLATNTTLNAIENKIPDHSKYVTTP